MATHHANMHLSDPHITDEPTVNPVERAMFHNIRKLLVLRIRPVLVFDGPGAPTKRNRNSEKVDMKKRELLKEIPDGLNVPYIDAVREAEAECCHLRSQGLIDAVWS